MDATGVGIAEVPLLLLPAFVARLGAAPFVVGLITALPALTGLLLALPIGRFLATRRNIVAWYAWQRFLYLSSFALIGIALWFVPPHLAVPTIVLIYVLATIPGTVLEQLFVLVLGAVFAPQRRYVMMSRRWSWLALVSAGTMLLASLVMSRVSFPLNYQLVFVASLGGALLSLSFARRLVLPAAEGTATEEAPQGRGTSWQIMLRENPEYRRFLFSRFVYTFGHALVLPILPLYWVQDAKISDFWIGLIGTASSALAPVGYFLCTAIVQRRGSRSILQIGSLAVACYPFVTGFVTAAPLLVLLAGIATLFLAGLELVFFDILLETIPQQERTAYLALSNFSLYLAAVGGPLVGSVIAEAASNQLALSVGSGLSLLGTVLFTMLKIGVSTPVASRT